MNRWSGIFFSIFMICLPVACQQKEAGKNIRPPAVAGTFYPGDASTLKQSIREFLNRAEEVEIDGKIVGLWAPHAGYVYSGQVAANAYRAVEGLTFDDVIIIAPSHRIYLNGASIPNWDAYQTPLGTVTVDQNLCRTIRKSSPQVQSVEAAHRQEHAVEVQLPFLQTVLPGVPIVPVVVGQMEIKDCRALARTIVQAAGDKKVLFIASSDMSHYPNYQDACSVDAEMLGAVQSMDPVQVFDKDRQLMQQGVPNLSCTLCGLTALNLVMLVSQYIDADVVRLMPYANSGDISGDHSRVVGYGAALFIDSKSGDSKKQGGVNLEELNISCEEQKTLFRVARESIRAALKGESTPDFNIESETLKKKRGVFVTLTNQGRLRGCIGRFDASLPLYQIVAQMAAAAAVQDTRFAFNPVTLAELESLDVKISILSPLKKIESIDEIEIGKHGIWIKQGNRHGTYLPEVATDLGWNKEEFLSHCCAEKAGLPANAWKTGAEIYIYASQVLDEKEN
ncbi:AmmeMemoRadiSam system protein B [bacterium]|nr:AmmeMemoRadiSam system protein B [bacterium]